MNSLATYRGVIMLIFICSLSFLKGQSIRGIVVDSETGESLPLVNVMYNAEKRQGTATNFDGKFEIQSFQEIGSQITFSFIGYQTLIVPKSSVPRSNNLWRVEIIPQTENLEEIDLLAKENPALRIVRNAIDNKDINDPKKYESFTYVSYNKDVITYTGTNLDSLSNRQDSAQAYRDQKNSQERHLMVVESVTRKYFKLPEKHKEIIIGTKISGFSDPSVGAVPDGFQTFGFYDNVIMMLNKKYLNPIANGADKKYIYFLEDTSITGTDTTFKMRYMPKLGSNFDGFKGNLHINSNKWAIEHITAYPDDEGKINLGMEQWYTLINGQHWFPYQMNFAISLERFPFRNNGAVMYGKSFLDSVEINIPLKDSLFNQIEVEVKQGSGKKDIKFWTEHRTEKLDIKEIETYRTLDSIGERYNFDAALRSTRNLYDGYLSFNNVDVMLNKLVAYNDWEGLRLGMGIYTNQDISEYFKVGGYVGHGTSDKVWKYGASFKYFFKKEKDNFIHFNYSNDVKDPGRTMLNYWWIGNFSSQFFNELMDSYEEASVFINWRFFNYFQFQGGLKNFRLSPNYDYSFTPAYQGGDPRNIIYKFSEAHFELRWVHKEEFRSNFGQRMSMGSDYPVVVLIYGRGLDNIGFGEYQYNKVELGFQYDHFFQGLGRTVLTLEGGYIDSPLPYSMNFSGRPSYKPDFSVLVTSTFNTMRFNEFSSTRYTSLFFMHDFKSLLFKSGYFKPEIRIFQGISYGTLDYKELHQSGATPLKTLEEGFFESGLVFDNVIRINMFNVGYIGAGIGAFYRYGPNRFQHDRDNWAIKLAFMYSIN